MSMPQSRSIMSTLNVLEHVPDDDSSIRSWVTFGKNLAVVCRKP